MKMSTRDREAWRLGFLACFKLLGDRVQTAFSMREVVLYAVTNGTSSPVDPPEEWPPSASPATKKEKS